jgi:hypothetical protein
MLLEAHVDTRTHTPDRPSSAMRARTVLATAASASVHWDGGRVDLLGCHHDDPLGDVILTLETRSTLAGAARAAPGGDLAVLLELTELCAVSARERVRSRVSLAGWLSAAPWATDGTEGTTCLHVEVTEVAFADSPHLGDRTWIGLADYRAAEPDPLHLGAADLLQHLAAHHPDAVAALSRLCDATTLQGVLRVLPVALDRYGVVLRVERLRGHKDVRLSFRQPVRCGAEAAAEMRHLLTEGSRRRPCQTRPAAGPQRGEASPSA